MSNSPMKRVSILIDPVTWARVQIANALHFRGIGRERVGGLLLKRQLDDMDVPFPVPAASHE